MIQSVVDRNRPIEGMYYRLMAEDGRLIPDRISRRPAASGIDVPPGVESGVFVIHYYTDPLKLDSEVRLVDDEPPPSLVVEGGAVIVSPMAWEERETAIQQRVERRDIENQRRSTLMNNLVQFTDVIKQIERECDQAGSLADKDSGSYIRCPNAIKRLAGEICAAAEHQQRGAGENLLKSTQAIGQALSTAKTDNLATVGSGSPGRSAGLPISSSPTPPRRGCGRWHGAGGEAAPGRERAHCRRGRRRLRTPKRPRRDNRRPCRPCRLRRRPPRQRRPRR